MVPFRFSTLNGTKPDGMAVLTNAFAFTTGLRLPSKTSTLPLLKFAAKSRGADEVPPSAHPLYTAPDLELSKSILACVPSTEEFQPEITPSSEQNRNEAGLPDATSRTAVFALKELKMTPVTGPPVGVPPAEGMLTTSAVAVPVPS